MRIAVLFVLEKAELNEFEVGLARYNGLKNTSQWKAFDEIILIRQDGHIEKKKPNYPSSELSERGAFPITGIKQHPRIANIQLYL